jgi:hypothetical protein
MPTDVLGLRTFYYLSASTGHAGPSGRAVSGEGLDLLYAEIVG